MLEAWYAARGTGWDQYIFGNLTYPEEAPRQTGPFPYVDPLDFDVFPNGCCGYCGDLIVALFKRSHNWFQSCHNDTYSKWASFHVACAQAGVMWRPEADLAVVKRDMMVAIYEMVTHRQMMPTYVI